MERLITSDVHYPVLVPSVFWELLPFSKYTYLIVMFSVMFSSVLFSEAQLNWKISKT